MSKGRTLSREEGYHFARMEVWFTTRSAMLVAPTVTEIFTIKIVYLKWRKKVTFLQKIYHNTNIPFWAGKIKIKGSQIRYKGVAKKVFKKHFSFCSSREHSRWQGGGIHKNFRTFVRQNTTFLIFFEESKKSQKTKKGWPNLWEASQYFEKWRDNKDSRLTSKEIQDFCFERREFRT